MALSDTDGPRDKLGRNSVCMAEKNRHGLKTWEKPIYLMLGMVIILMSLYMMIAAFTTDSDAARLECSRELLMTGPPLPSPMPP